MANPYTNFSGTGVESTFELFYPLHLCMSSVNTRTLISNFLFIFSSFNNGPDFFPFNLYMVRNCIHVKDVSRLPLSEDPALAMAFSVARRAAAVPLLLVNGTYRKNIHTYLDSAILQYQLQRMNDHGSLKGSLHEMLMFS